MTRKSAKAAEASSSASSPEPTGSLDDSMFDGSVDVTNAESWMSRSYEDAEPPVNVNRPFAFKNQNYKPPKKPRFPKAIVTQEKAIPAPVNAVRCACLWLAVARGADYIRMGVAKAVSDKASWYRLVNRRASFSTTAKEILRSDGTRGTSTIHGSLAQLLH